MARGLALTEAALAHALDAVRGAVLAAFPGGLPPWDPVRRGIEGAAQGQVKPLSHFLCVEIYAGSRGPREQLLGRHYRGQG